MLLHTRSIRFANRFVKPYQEEDAGLRQCS